MYLMLLTLAVPWYWPPGDLRHRYGFPLWVLTVLGVLAVTACFTAWVYATSPDDDSE